MATTGRKSYDWKEEGDNTHLKIWGQQLETLDEELL
jgi:hypothetical protein